MKAISMRCLITLTKTQIDQDTASAQPPNECLRPALLMSRRQHEANGPKTRCTYANMKASGVGLVAMNTLCLILIFAMLIQVRGILPNCVTSSR